MSRGIDVAPNSCRQVCVYLCGPVALASPGKPRDAARVCYSQRAAHHVPVDSSGRLGADHKLERPGLLQTGTEILCTGRSCECSHDLLTERTCANGRTDCFMFNAGVCIRASPPSVGTVRLFAFTRRTWTRENAAVCNHETLF